MSCGGSSFGGCGGGVVGSFGSCGGALGTCGNKNVINPMLDREPEPLTYPVSYVPEDIRRRQAEAMFFPSYASRNCGGSSGCSSPLSSSGCGGDPTCHIPSGSCSGSGLPVFGSCG